MAARKPRSSEAPEDTDQNPDTDQPDTEPDPVVGVDDVDEQPGTEESARMEVHGDSKFSEMDETKLANIVKLFKNKGLIFQFGDWSVPGMRLRMQSMSHPGVSAFQTDENMTIRANLPKALRDGELPIPAHIHLNAQVIKRTMVEWECGEVDIGGAARVIARRNAGFRFAIPRETIFRGGVVLILLPIAHPWILMVRRAEIKRLKRAFAKRPGDDLPGSAMVLVERAMIEASILGWHDGTIRHNGGDFDLKNSPSEDVREFFRDAGFLTLPDLSGSPPAESDELEDYLDEKLEVLDGDFMKLLMTGQEQLRTTPPREILVRGDDFCLGADWDESEPPEYQPQEGDLVNWSDISKEELRRNFEILWPKIPYTSSPPQGMLKKEKFYLEKFKNFGMDELNELMDLHGMLDKESPVAIAKKGRDFVVGAQ